MKLLAYWSLVFAWLAPCVTCSDMQNNTVPASKSVASVARSLVSQATWGVVSYLQNNEEDIRAETRTPLGEILSFADSNGHIFFYLMGTQTLDIALTLTEASLQPYSNLQTAGCGKKGNVDAEDPRCAKLTLTGKVTPCPRDSGSDLCQQGWQALSERHLDMKNWPKNHNFIVHQLNLDDIWMIANYGGASVVEPDVYYKANIDHDENESTQLLRADGDHIQAEKESLNYPSWDKKAERARWIVANALWTTVSTVSVRLKGRAWGNIRSIVDGGKPTESTGLPIFYFPTPDESMKDIEENPLVSLTISEASLAQRLSQDGQSVCDGQDPESPLCARVVLTGTAVAVEKQELASIQDAFGRRHPYAPWLAKGGAHTGGKYMTIQLEQIMILDYYGGATEVKVDDYLGVKPASLSSATKLRGSKFKAREGSDEEEEEETS